jgi:hypothetical protein
VRRGLLNICEAIEKEYEAAELHQLGRCLALVRDGAGGVDAQPLVTVALLGLATVGSAAVAFTSVGTAVLATLLILSGLVLGAMEWAERR